MSKKVSTAGRLLTAADFLRIRGQNDNSNDFYEKNSVIHGYLYLNLASDVTAANAPILFVGPQNEITLQPIGTVTIGVQGSLDGTTFVTANTVASADGFVRVQSKYRAIRVSATGTAGNPSVYLMTS